MTREGEHFDVLSVEDQPDTMSGTLSELKVQHRSIRIDLVKDVSSARERLRNNRYSVILIDLRLPDKEGGQIEMGNGVKLYEEIRRGKLGDRNIDAPCLLVTAQSLNAIRMISDEKDVQIYSKGASMYPLVDKILALVGGSTNTPFLAKG